MKAPKEEVIDMPPENLDSPKLSSEKDYDQNNDYPVEIKPNENTSPSEESDEITESSIQASVRAGFVRKVYGILSIQLMITFGAVLLCQLKPIKQAIFSHPALSGNLVIFASLSFLVLFLCLACCRDLSKKVPYNYIFLLAITLCEAISCSIAASIYSFQIVALSLLLTIVTTLAITFYACTTKTDFSLCRMGLYVLFSQMFVIGLIAALFRIKALYTFDGLIILIKFFVLFRLLMMRLRLRKMLSRCSHILLVSQLKNLIQELLLMEKLLNMEIL